MNYPAERLTDAERALLAPHVTSLDGPVFALTSLPETTKAMLFARYSRYQGTLRRLMLDEFSDALGGQDGVRGEGEHAADVASRVFAAYGDDSVAQLAGVHVACEWSSNILTKILQRGRIASYLEQSTRYIAFDRPVAAVGAEDAWAGQFRYWRSPDLGERYTAAMDELFVIYSQLLVKMEAWARETFPRAADEPQAAYDRAVKAKALDAVRGLLPAASLSHMGIYASGQAYESLVLHLLAHPLAEARRYGQMLLAELQQVIPSFLVRVDRPERGGVWVDFLAGRRERADAIVSRLGLDAHDAGDHGPSVRMVACEGDETELLAALLFESADVDERRALDVVGALDRAQVQALIGELVGERPNRRHRPGRGFERLTYRFEIVSDYGAFRDLQRHRMLTSQWQELTPDLGAEVTPEVVSAGVEDEFRRALEISAAEHARLKDEGHGPAAQYALCLAFRLRYVLQLNARELVQLTELRSGKQGHPSYRAVALEMARQVGERHPTVGAALTHLDRSTDERLERIESEIRNESRR